MIRTLDQIESLHVQGLVTIETPPAAGSPAIPRWFFCPVIKDPRNGAIAPDAHLALTTGLPAADEFVALFNCLQSTGGDQCSPRHRSDCDEDGSVSVNDIFTFINWFMSGSSSADFDRSGTVNTDDIFEFLGAWFAGT